MPTKKKGKEEVAARLTYTRRRTMSLRTREEVSAWLRREADQLLHDDPADYVEKFVTKFWFGRGLK